MRLIGRRLVGSLSPSQDIDLPLSGSELCRLVCFVLRLGSQALCEEELPSAGHELEESQPIAVHSCVIILD